MKVRETVRNRKKEQLEFAETGLDSGLFLHAFSLRVRIPDQTFCVS